MNKYLLLIWNHCDTYDRHYIKCDTLERARALAHTYTKDRKYTAEIYLMPELIEVC